MDRNVRAALLHGKKAPRIVAAIDGRNVTGQERLHAPRVVPIEQMSAVMGEAERLSKVRCRRDAELVRADVAEIVGRQRRQEQHSDVRRGGAMRRLLMRLLLVIVDRKPLIIRSNEGLEEHPCSTSEPTQLPPLLGKGGLLALNGWLTQHAISGATNQSRRIGAARNERRRPRPATRRHGSQAAMGDPFISRQRTGRGVPAEADSRVGRGGPLQKSLPGDDGPDGDANDRVDTTAASWARNATARGSAPGWPSPARIAAAGGRRSANEKRGRRPSSERAPRQPGPAERESAKKNGASRLRRRLSKIFHRSMAEMLVLDRLSLGRRDPGEEPREQLPVAAHPTVHAPRVDRVVGRIPLEEHDVCNERGAAVDPLEEVVACERVLGYATLDAAHESVDVVDPLADVDPSAEESW